MNIGTVAVLVGGCLLLGFFALLALLYLQRSQTKEKQLTKGQKFALCHISKGLDDSTMRRFFKYERDGGPLWQIFNSLGRSDVTDKYYEYLVKLHASQIGEKASQKRRIIEGLTTWKIRETKTKVGVFQGEFSATIPHAEKLVSMSNLAVGRPATAALNFRSPPLVNMGR